MVICRPLTDLKLDPTLWTLHHWWTTRRCWSYWSKDHCRHVRWMGCSRWWCFLWQGFLQGRQISCIPRPLDCQVFGQCQACPPCARPTLIRHWCRGATFHLCRYLWYLCIELCRASRDHPQELRPPTRCHCQGARFGPTNLLPNSQERSLHQPELQLGEAKDSQVLNNLTQIAMNMVE